MLPVLEIAFDLTAGLVTPASIFYTVGNKQHRVQVMKQCTVRGRERLANSQVRR